MWEQNPKVPMTSAPEVSPRSRLMGRRDPVGTTQVPEQLIWRCRDYPADPTQHASDLQAECSPAGHRREGLNNGVPSLGWEGPQEKELRVGAGPQLARKRKKGNMAISVLQPRGVEFCLAPATPPHRLFSPFDLDTHDVILCLSHHWLLGAG